MFPLSQIFLGLCLSTRLALAGVTTSTVAVTNQTFDYIVVGGGLTGTTVAARLAEDPSVTVLLIEAGQDNRLDPRVYDIYNYDELFNHSNLNWAWPADQGREIPRSVDLLHSSPLSHLTNLHSGRTLGGSCKSLPTDLKPPH